MATDYKTLQPMEFYQTFLDRKTRPDGRSLLEFRRTTLSVGSVGTADGSAIVRCGNTTVVCGIKAEIGPPEHDDPSSGYIVTNVTLPPLCSPRIKSGPPGETAQAATQFAAELVAGGGVVDLSSLCITPAKWVWVLHVDLVCINLDGGLLDACSVALIAALRNLTLPVVTYDEELDKLTWNPDGHRVRLENVKQPVTSTFAIFEKGALISDPTDEEEQLASGTISVTMEGDQVAHLYKPGGSSLDDKKMKKLLKHSELKAQEVVRLIQEACSGASSALNVER